MGEEITIDYGSVGDLVQEAVKTTEEEEEELVTLKDEYGNKIGARNKEGTVWHNYLPILEELHARGGHPGVMYCFTWANEASELQENGWIITPGCPYITVHGPKGEASCILMQRGDPIIGAEPGAGRRHCFYSLKITELTGLEDKNIVVEDTPVSDELEAAGFATADKPAPARKAKPPKPSQGPMS